MNEQPRVITAEEFNRQIQSIVMDKSEAIANHTRIGNDPVRWEITARALFAASKAVKDERERMSDIGKSIGRYPIGTAAETRVRYWSLKDDDIVEDFIARLKAQIRQMRSQAVSQKGLG